MAGSFLERIVDARRTDAAARAAELPEWRDRASDAPSVRDFHAALAVPGLSLIAEVKRASPSAGAIAPGDDLLARVDAYERAGASAISVLTEPDHFGGSLEDLREARTRTYLPLMRKDFVCDPLHVYEARACGADALLLIVTTLPDDDLATLIGLAEMLGMATLVEVHDAGDVTRALDAGARIVGINTRNLRTLEVHPEIVGELRRLIPPDVLVVGESGIRTRADVEAMEQAGCDAILVGEALMRTGDPVRAVADLLAREGRS